MWARITKAEGFSQREFEEALRSHTEVSIPRFQQEPSFRGALALVERDAMSTTGLSITLWESRKDIRLSREIERELRGRAVEMRRTKSEAPPPEMGIYEVVADTFGWVDLSP